MLKSGALEGYWVVGILYLRVAQSLDVCRDFLLGDGALLGVAGPQHKNGKGECSLINPPFKLYQDLSNFPICPGISTMLFLLGAGQT